MLTILVGSGLSFRLPCVEQLTNEIYHGSGWYRASDQRYRHSPVRNKSYDYETVQRAIILVNAVKDLVNEHFTEHATRKATYEDIYTIVRYLEDWSVYPHSTSDPVSTVILGRIREKILPALMPASEFEWDQAQLAQATNKYIHDVVCAKLRPQVDTGYLDSLVECLKSYGCVTIVTLNHDCLLDDKLTTAGIDIQDGFKKGDDGVRAWKRYHILNPCESIRLVKLHGSLEWSWLIGKSQRDDRIVFGFHPNRNPLVLIGTTTKSSDYHRFIYYDMMGAFDRALRQSDHLLVCGYGFMDRVVNEKLREWIVMNRKSRVSIVGIKPKEDVEHDFGFIPNERRDYSDCGVERADWNKLVENLTNG